MKTTIIRALAVAMLATSMSAFAATSDSKPTDAASPCNTTKQNDSAVKSKENKKEKKDQHKQKEENSDQFSGIWG